MSNITEVIEAGQLMADVLEGVKTLADHEYRSYINQAKSVARSDGLLQYCGYFFEDLLKSEAIRRDISTKDAFAKALGNVGPIGRRIGA